LQQAAVRNLDKLNTEDTIKYPETVCKLDNIINQLEQIKANQHMLYEAVQEAEDMIDKDVQVDIQGYDIDPDVVAAARENAKRAGVEHMIHFQQRAVADLHHPKKYGFIISNPPYGERLEEKSALPALYSQIGEAYKRLDAWSMYLITSYEDTERYIGRKADKNRKIYNGMIKTYFYQFMGPKPPRRKKD